MTYKDSIKTALTKISQDDKVVHVGYNLKWSGGVAEMLSDINPDQIIEMPLAENLMTGFAIGMAIEGFKPILHFERFDFITNAMDAIVNHLDKIKDISHGEYNPTMIIRCVVGNKEKPLFTGATHTQDFTFAMSEIVNFPVLPLKVCGLIAPRYNRAYYDLRIRSTLLVEYKDLYDQKI